MTLISMSRAIRAVGAATAFSWLSLPVCAQSLGLAPKHEISIWRVLLALVFCCLLGVAGALALKYRLKNKRPNIKTIFSGGQLRNLLLTFRWKPKTGEAVASRLQVVESVSLPNQVDVSLVACDGTVVMIVTSPHGAFIVNPDKAVKSETGA